MQKHLIVLTGPTGIGKTSIGIKIAKHFKTEIVSSDSRQIFKELSVGTAVPNKAELTNLTHHLIQNHSIEESYNASKFEIEALDIINSLFKKHNLVLLVGGSMLYIDAVCKGIDIMPDADPGIRRMLKKKFETEGIESLRLQLKKLDPNYYESVDLKNPNRIIHALEICIMTGKAYSSFRSNPKKTRSFSTIKIGLNCDRKYLHDRINSRVDNMINAGLEKEAREYYHLKHLNSLNTVGYREFFAYFDGEISREKAIELIKRNTRRYARKQLTWFRNDIEMSWFEPNQANEIITFIEKQISVK
ncbi:tRNA (adenosine(37)-N6)-dimethylallyltransferase MiaA [Draconibacterium sp.]